MEFREGHIEDLGRANIANESVDIVISNCVMNLSPDKEQVVKAAFRVLAMVGSSSSVLYVAAAIARSCQGEQGRPLVPLLSASTGVNAEFRHILRACVGYKRRLTRSRCYMCLL